MLVIEYTRNEQRILEVLSDGRNHAPQELLESLIDDMAGMSALQMHISRLRKKLAQVGQDIKCVVTDHGFCYCHVRLISKGE